ncbi:MAG: ThuA domain-containing protein [Clostridia bacterium]|nr:ThuA domain-containing protein [Clostridia bacterium]
MIRVLVWNEFMHEKDEDNKASSIYPDGIHNYIAGFLGKEEDIEVSTATLDDENCGITKERLENTDVIIWWGHCGHHKVPDEVAVLVQEAVLNGMGAIFLHSAHKSKPFMRLMGTSCSLTWRESDDLERVWVNVPSHPIAQGIGRYFELPGEETYGEPFGIPTPDELIFTGWFEGGEVFRSGCTWTRDNGRVFYFQPGHETYPTYKNPDVQKIILNAVRWCNPVIRIPDAMDCPCLPRVHSFNK